ncbi:Zn(2)-C6 fungal-type domain-containing protein [Madurella fahalii]|uniref:Zn(2)-C6 fungal-type domain-containing protein n=1 Tax=Madurella fahalii TaxID=1157608 RepID=A0ABQ0GTS5_9PEZI
MEEVVGGSESPPPDASHANNSVPRACDACRTRKIRCNRESPCAHCLHAKIECTHSETRPREKRTRILLTHQYEKKIDHIDRRLDGVVRLLEDLKVRLPSPSKTLSEPAAAVRTIPSPVPSPASHVNNADTTSTVAEGASSLTAHSVFANDLLQKVVSEDARPEMRERIEALHHVVEAMKKQPASHEMTYPHAKPVKPTPLQGCSLPPIERTLEILKLSKSQKNFCVTWVFEFFNMGRLPEICLAVYLADSYDAASFITANAGLHILFSAYANEIPGRKEEFLAASSLCGVNLETALCSLPLHLPANNDVIVALLLGVFYTVELSKPSLAWVLSSKASELCQTLGYHRIGSHKNETPHEQQRKQFLFWVTYVLDKSLSLRLGRPPTIQDYDITVPYPSSDDPERALITDFLRLWVIASKIQGQIYELLYCPEAIAQPLSVRQSRVQLLVHQLEELETMTQETADKWTQYSVENLGEDTADFFVIADHVLRLSTLTLVHRAVPNPVGSSTTFTAECIRAARATLARHQDCMAVVERSGIGLFSSYMSWTILFAPFVPFIVLFCHVIETKDKTDLARLQAFVASLQLDCTVPEAVDKLRRLFQILYSVASQYIESQTDAFIREDQRQPSTGIDTYLAVLGFPPSSQPSAEQEQQYPEFGSSTVGGSMSDSNSQEYQRGVNPMIWMGNGIQLQDWFYSNQEMMTLLDEFVDGSG